MAINLLTKYGDKLAEMYTKESFLKGKSSNEYRWNGARYVEILSVQTQALNDYNRNASANRYGTPTELADMVQIIEIDKDKSFALVVDKGNNTQQGMLKEAGKVMRQQIGTQVVPYADKLALGEWAKWAGKTVAASAAVSTSNIISLLVAIEDAMSDELVPMEGRYVAVANSTVSLFRQALTNCDTVTDKLLIKGVAGKLGSLNIIGVPSSWLPTNVIAVAWHKDAVVAPEQINETKLHIDPPGISGNLLEGRFLLGAAVIGAKCGGTYALYTTGNKISALTVSNAGALTSVSGHTYKYTNDGTDPRYSKTAIKVTASGASTSLTHTSGDTLKVIEYADGKGTSDVASVVTTS